MVEVIESYIDLCTGFINDIFMFQVELEQGMYVPVGKLAVAFVFTVFAIYFILDAIGILDKGGDD